MTKFYMLRCEVERKERMHSVEDDMKEKIQTITCMTCGNSHREMILSMTTKVSESIGIAYQESKNNGKQRNTK